MSKEEQKYDTVIPEQEITAEGRSFAVEDNDLDHYVGVSPEYMTYASDTEKPMLTDAEIDALEAADEGDQDNPAVPSAESEPSETPAPEPSETPAPEPDAEPAAPAENTAPPA